MGTERAFPVIRQTVLDTTDPRRLAEFYRQLFGLRYCPGDEPPAPGQPDSHGQDWLILTSPAGGPALAFQKVGELPETTWPDGPVPQQLHLDATVPTTADLDVQHERALALGARCLRVEAVVMAVSRGTTPASVGSRPSRSIHHQRQADRQAVRGRTKTEAQRKLAASSCCISDAGVQIEQISRLIGTADYDYGNDLQQADPPVIWMALTLWTGSSLGRVGGTLSYSAPETRRRGSDYMPSELVGVAGFEPAASSSRSQRVMWSTTVLTPSDLPRTVRGRPQASAGVCGGCYSVSYSPCQGCVARQGDVVVVATASAASVVIRDQWSRQPVVRVPRAAITRRPDQLAVAGSPR